MTRSIGDVVDARRQEAVKAYFVGVWAGESVETLLDLGTAAGRTPTEVQADLDVAARARKLVEETGRLAEARQRLTRAEGEFTRAKAQLDKAVTKLRPQVEAAGFAADSARRAIAAAETAARDLLRLFRERPELVPAAALPAAVNELLEGERRDAGSLDLQQRRAAARQVLEAARARVRQAQECFNQQPMTVDYEKTQTVHNKRLAAAQDALRAAQAEYDRAAQADKD